MGWQNGLGLSSNPSFQKSCYVFLGKYFNLSVSISSSVNYGQWPALRIVRWGLMEEICAKCQFWCLTQNKCSINALIFLLGWFFLLLPPPSLYFTSPTQAWVLRITPAFVCILPIFSPTNLTFQIFLESVLSSTPSCLCCDFVWCHPWPARMWSLTRFLAAGASHLNPASLLPWKRKLLVDRHLTGHAQAP